MNAASAIDQERLQRFRAAIAAGLGIAFDDGRLGQLVEVLDRRVAATGEEPERYLDRLARRPPPREEIRQLARELTVPETYFFRNMDQFRALGERVLPERLAARGGQGPLRLLSAGCASGEEAWSLAILVTDLADNQSLPPGVDVTVDAVDVNVAMLARARQRRYSPWSLREVPTALKQRWFRRDGDQLVLARELRAQATFHEQNLALAPGEPDPWPSSGYDVVFCRNVLMYFTLEHAQAVVARIARTLAPGGYLFLGHAETLRGLSGDFELCHTHDTFYYQRRPARRAADLGAGAGNGATAGPPPGLVSADGPDAPLTPAAIAALDGVGSWAETVARASDRIRQLSQEPPAGATAGRQPSRVPRPAPDRAAALDLLRQERFSEALALLGDEPTDVRRDPDGALLRATLLTHSGALAEAERVCRQLLELDGMSAGAHYLLALCREAAGDRIGATSHDQTAAHLDPTFAMPRLHLGLMARREGQRARAEAELRQAARLLAREQNGRLTLFGGGFGREGLIALCRGELARLGGPP